MTGPPPQFQATSWLLRTPTWRALWAGMFASATKFCTPVFVFILTQQLMLWAELLASMPATPSAA
jgi:hypothetical protein